MGNQQQEHHQARRRTTTVRVPKPVYESVSGQAKGQPSERHAHLLLEIQAQDGDVLFEDQAARQRNTVYL